MLILEREEGRQKEKERERDRQTDIDQLPPVCAPMGGQTHNLGMCPEWELNPQPFRVWDNIPTN